MKRSPVRPDGGRRDRDGGYLLVEALATLALSALVLSALLALGGGLSRAVDRAAVRVETGETGRRAVAAMAAEISQLARRRFAGGEGTFFVFLGAPDRLVFALDPLQQDGLRAPVAVAYQAVSGELLRAEGELPIGATGLGDVDLSRPRRLDVGGDVVRFAYVEQRDDGGELVTDSWERPTALPRAIRIDRVDPKTGAVVVSRRVPIVSQTEAGCVAPDRAFCSTKTKPAESVAPPPVPAPTGADR